jgi:glycosyltransferase involved in cell wall biosynthesis
MTEIIHKDISRRVVMTGVKYKDNHPGGISAVIQYWARYIDGIRYYPTFKEGSILSKVSIFAKSYTLLLFALLLDRRIKIVHVHTAAGTDFYRSTKIIELAKKFNKKVILHSHASKFKDYYYSNNELEKQKILTTLRKVDLLIVLSKSWAEWFEGIGVDKPKITILHNITDYPHKTHDEKSDPINRPVRFLFMGEIGERKGVFDIIKALANHRDEFLGKVQLRIGGNKKESELHKAITDGNLDNMVKFEGWVSGDKKIELLNWADVYILPSFNEGLPISILEAMSYGMPIISTPVGGIPEVVDKTNGILVTPGNDSEIYESIKYYVENRQMISLHGNASTRRAETYLPDFVLDHLKHIYESLLT